MVNDRIIQTDKIINTLESHFSEIINKDNYYKGHKIKIANEQYFVREKDPGTIYIVFKLGTAEINYGQSSVPITLVAISERNGVNICQNLLIDFVQKYNLQWSEDKTIKEFWQTPNVISNFEEIYDGFRSTLYTTGSFLITENTNFFELEYLNYNFESNNKELEKKVRFESLYWFEKIKDTDLFDKKIIYHFDAHTDNVNVTITNIDFLRDKLNELKINDKKITFEYKIISLEKSVQQRTWSINGIKIKLEDFGLYYDGEPVYINEENYSKFVINIIDDNWYKDGEVFDFEKFHIVLDYSNYYNGDFIVLTKKWEHVNAVSTTTGTSINVDPQVFYQSNNFTESIGMYGSKVISLSMYSFDDNFCNKCLAIYLEDLEEQPDGVDTKFYLKLKFRNGKEKENIYKMTSYMITDNLGEIPVIALSFTK